MPPQVALLLCTVFVLFLLVVERKNSPQVSLASWIPTIWILTVASKSLAIWFGATGENESGSPADQALLLSLTGLGLVLVGVRRFDWAGALSRQRWLLALLAYMLVSTLWSEISFIAFRRWVRELIVLIMALVVASEPRPYQALESVLRRAAYILIPFSLLLIKYYSRLGIRYTRWEGKEMWVGVTVHKNTLGALAMVSAFLLLWTFCRRWRQQAPADGRWQVGADASVLVIALFLLKGPQNAYSATSIGSFAVSAAALFGLIWLRKHRICIPRQALLASALFLIVFGVLTPFVGGSTITVFSSSFGRDETLTGRTNTWADLVPVVEDDPLFGYGIGSFWTTARQDYYEMSFAHNGYLDILLEFGFVGLAFFCAWLMSCARSFHRVLAVDYDWASLAICFLLMALVYNFAESALNTLTGLITVVLAIASGVPYKQVHASR